MAKVSRCEKCGAIHEEEKFGNYSDKEMQVQNLYDLCSTCLRKHSNFMNNVVEITYINPENVKCGECSRRMCAVNSSNNEAIYCDILKRNVNTHEKPCYFFKPQKQKNEKS